MLRHVENTTGVPAAQETRMVDSINHVLTLENFLLTSIEWG